MKTKIFLAFLAVLGFLVSCSVNPHPMDMTQAIQSAQSPADHEALAKHYEDAARAMQAKAQEHKKLLAQYEAARGLDSRQVHNLIIHCEWLIRTYEQAATENLSMAKSHREIAVEAK